MKVGAIDKSKWEARWSMVIFWFACLTMGVSRNRMKVAIVKSIVKTFNPDIQQITAPSGLDISA